MRLFSSNTPYYFTFSPATGPADVAALYLDRELAEFLIVSSKFPPAELVLLLKFYPEKGARFVQQVIRMRCRSRRTIREIRREAWEFNLYCSNARRLHPRAMYRPRKHVVFTPATNLPTEHPVRRWVDRVLMCDI